MNPEQQMKGNGLTSHYLMWPNNFDGTEGQNIVCRKFYDNLGQFWNDQPLIRCLSKTSKIVPFNGQTRFCPISNGDGIVILKAYRVENRY